MKRIFSVLALLCPFLSPGQHSPLQPLSTGDLLPAVSLQIVSGSTPAKVQLSRYRGRLVILDLWATWCVPCIKELPKLDSLQKVYGNRITVIAVSYQPAATIKAFLARNQAAAGAGIIYAAEDSILSRLFPHGTFPHEAWIDASGKVYAVTSAGQVNSENIDRALSGQPFRKRQKLEITGIKERQPLLLSGNDKVGRQLLYQSAFYRYLPGLGTSFLNRPDSARLLLRYTNFPLLQLYNNLLQLPSFYRRLVLEVRDSSRYLPPKDNPPYWEEDNSYTLELVAPAGADAGKIKASGLADLSRYLGIRAGMEKRQRDCMILRSLPGATAVAPLKKAAMPGTAYTIDGDSLVLNGAPVSELVKMLNLLPQGNTCLPYYIDETNAALPISIAIPASLLTDLPALGQYLLRYGITLTAEKRAIDCFVISDP